ncbi:pilus assembly protein [Oceanimonas baumannii]|uniref:Flp family type IVb pilin n=1 Tax=Oceanimonas baumannii TaxID=129578 RepID=UPI001D18CBE2|nr:pilus assembly protein [Oceanimonas baumannii]MCC4263835.1 pilus assembly protein [Oceanimonas baumannii]
MFIAKELLRLVNDENGLTIVEYAIAGGLVAAGVVLAFTSLGSNVKEVINGLCNATAAGASNAGGTGTTC